MFHREAKLLLGTMLAALIVSHAATGVARAQTLPALTENVQPAAENQRNSQARESLHISLRLKATLIGHKKSVSEMAFSPDGELLATGSEDNTVRLWKAGTGELKAVLSLAEKQKLDGFWWNGDGRKLAVIGFRRDSGKGQLRVWEARTGELKTTIELNHSDYLTGFTWSPDGRVLMTTSEDGTAKLWDAETGRLMETLNQAPISPNETDSFFKSFLPGKRLSDLRVTAGYFDATGQSVLTLSYNQPPKLWDATTAKLKTVLPLSEEPSTESYPPYPGRALISPDRRLVVRADDQGITLLDTATGEAKHLLGEIGQPLAFSPDGSRLLTKEYSIPRALDQLSIWDAFTGQKIMRFEKLPYGVKDIYWSPKGNRLVVEGYYDMHTHLVDAQTGRIVAKLPYDGCAPGSWFGSSGCASFIFSADGRIMLKQKNPLRLWSAETGELLTVMETADAFSRFSPTDQQLLVTRAKDKKTLLLWEISIQ